jgi:hypothetical protein
MAMTQSEIYSLAKAAGLNDSRAKVAAAIAMAESGGDPNAHNSKPPDNSYGLWQVNMIGTLGPARRKSLHLSSNDDLFNPATNAKAMKSISSAGGNFNPWSTYTSGAYRKYLTNDVTDEGSGHWYSGIPIVGGAIDSAEASARAAAEGIGYVEKTAAWLSNAENWIRIAYVAGGATIVVVGLVMIVTSSNAGRAGMKAASTAAKVIK